MEIQSYVDSWRFEERCRDAALYSQQLIQGFPIPTQKPLFFPNPNERRRFTGVNTTSREEYRQLLESIDRDEYGLHPSDTATSPLFEKVDHLQVIQRKHTELRHRLHHTLSATSLRSSITSRDKPQRMYRVIKPYPIPLKKTYQLKHMDEIEQLRDRLAQLSQADSQHRNDLFYHHIAQRETNVYTNETICDVLYELVEETFEEERLSLGRELGQEELAFVEDCLHGGPFEQVLIDKYQVQLTRRHLQCLLPETWLNDEVINFYMLLMMDRDQAFLDQGIIEKKSHFFSSFFYTKVSEGGYNYINVRRWTRKIDIFAMDKIFIPVNVANKHWCMAVIYMTEKRIQYYDSLNGRGTHVLNVLFKYLQDESENKKKQPFDTTDWKLIESSIETTPQQDNGSDCGVFSCMAADYIARNLPLSYSARDMNYHRHRMILHIARGTMPLDEEP